MRSKSIVSTALLTCACALASFGAQAEIRKDLQLHFVTSAGLAAAALPVFRDNPNRFWYSAGTAFAVGVVKELADSRQSNNFFDSKDLAADALGALAGAYFSDRLVRPVISRSASGAPVLGVAVHIPLR